MCRCCGRSFNERTGTRYEGIHLPKEVFDSVIGSRSDGLSVRETGRELGVSIATVDRYARKLSEDNSPFKPVIRQKSPDFKTRDNEGMLPRYVPSVYDYHDPKICSRPLRVDIPDDILNEKMMLFEGVLASAGFNRTESRVLSFLTAYVGLTMTDIANLSGMLSTSITKACETLESMGLINIRPGKTNNRGRPYRYLELAVDPGDLLSIIRDRMFDNLSVLDDVGDSLYGSRK